MKLVILGSGGATPTPRPFCQCKICKKARIIGEPYKRNSSSLLINDIKTIIDCGEDIGDSLNRRGVEQVDNLFITHWHPDHTFGFRPILEAYFDHMTNTANRAINLYVPNRVFKTLKDRYPSIDYFINTQKTANLYLLEDEDKITIGSITISVVGYQGEKSDTYAYLIEQNYKKVLYSPCDTISFDNYTKFTDLDLLINECGLFSNTAGEISFSKLIDRLKEINPKLTILTHIEELELNGKEEEYLQEIKDRYSDVKFDFAYDGMEIKI